MFKTTFKLSTKLIIAATVILVLLFGISTIVSFVFIRDKYEETVTADIHMNSSLAKKLVVNYTESIKSQLLEQIDIFSAIFSGDYSLNFDEREQIGNYNAPTLRKGNFKITEEQPTIKRMTKSVGMDLTFFVWDENEFKRISTTMQADDSVYGKPLRTSPESIPVLRSGQMVFNTVVMYNIPRIAVTYPLKNSRGEVVGVLASAASLERVISVLQEDFKNINIGGKGGYIALFSASDGTILVDPSFVGKNGFDLDPHYKQMADMKNGTTSFTLDQNGKRVEYTASFETLDGLGWVIYTAVPKETISSVSTSLLLLLLINMVVTTIIIVIMIRFALRYMVTKPLDNINEELTLIASGNFTSHIEIKDHDEIGYLAANLNNTVDELNGILSLLNTTAQEVYKGANNVGEANTNMAQGAIQQTKSTEAMNRTVDGLNGSISDMAKHMDITIEEVAKMRENAETGGAVLSETVKSITTLSKSVVHSSESINELAESSEKIADVLQVINDIADQTNLLALNAAIEAARAGEAGRGFAVVADEVRKLAEKTMGATKEISGTVSNIRAKIDIAINDMDKGVGLAKEGEASTKNLNVEIENILKGILSTSDKINQVMVILSQQTSATDDMINHVHTVAEKAEQNSSLASDSMIMVEDLKKLASQLLNRISTFKLK